jgi:hypothetical protein
MTRSSKKRAMVMAAVSALALGAQPREARAGRVNTPATACVMNDFSNAWQSSTATPWALGKGPNGGVTNPDSQFHEIVCPIVRNPNPSATSVSVYFDGTNNSGGTFRCTFFVYDYRGNVVNWKNVSDTVQVIDRGATLTVSSQYDYIIASCNMSYSGRTELRGFTVGE